MDKASHRVAVVCTQRVNGLNGRVGEQCILSVTSFPCFVLALVYVHTFNRHSRFTYP